MELLMVLESYDDRDDFLENYDFNRIHDISVE